MTISINLTSEELAALARAAKSAGFSNLSCYLHQLMLQGVHSQLARKR